VEFLPALQQGTINVLLAPSLAAEQLQWTSRIDHMNTGIPASASVPRSVAEAARRAHGEQRDIMQKTGAIATTLLGGIIRGKDMDAFNRLKANDGARPERSRKRRMGKGLKKACQRVKLALRGTCCRRSVTADRLRRRRRGALTPRRRGGSTTRGAASVTFERAILRFVAQCHELPYVGFR